MIPGIDPRVDIAFKKVFGTPAWRELTISLIDAVLQPAPGHRMVELDLLDPYSERDSPDDKLTVLDIKARDERGRWFNVEMQMNLAPSLAPRLLYYWAQLYSRQLVVADEFSRLRPTISICFLNQKMFPEHAAYHSVFCLLEREDQRCLTEHEEIHLVEMPKFRRGLDSLREPLDFWLYFFQNGKELDADALPAPLGRPEIRRAMEVLKVFSQSDVEWDRYENRLKGLRDHRAMVRERDEAVQQLQQAQHTLEQVEQQREQAEQQREQAEQEVKQGLCRQIQLCQRLLGQDRTNSQQLLNLSIDELRDLADPLAQQLPVE